MIRLQTNDTEKAFPNRRQFHQTCLLETSVSSFYLAECAFILGWCRQARIAERNPATTKWIESNGPTVSEVVSNSLRGSGLACVSGILLSVIVSCIARIMASQVRPLVGYLYISLLHQMCHLPKRGSFLIIRSAFQSYPGILLSMVRVNAEDKNGCHFSSWMSVNSLHVTFKIKWLCTQC